MSFQFLFPWELIGLPNEVMAKKKPTGKIKHQERKLETKWEKKILAEMLLDFSLKHQSYLLGDMHVGITMIEQERVI